MYHQWADIFSSVYCLKAKDLSKEKNDRYGEILTFKASYFWSVHDLANQWTARTLESSPVNPSLSKTNAAKTVTTLYLIKKPDIFDWNLKTNHQILIILIRIFLTQLAIKLPFSFLPYPMYAFALPRENRSSAICVEINFKKPEKTSPTLSTVT